MTTQETWTIEDATDCSPMQYLVGCLRGDWSGDDESISNAIVTVVSALYAETGMDPDTAVGRAFEDLDGKDVSLDLTANGLSITINGGEVHLHSPTW